MNITKEVKEGTTHYEIIKNGVQINILCNEKDGTFSVSAPASISEHIENVFGHETVHHASFNHHHASNPAEGIRKLMDLFIYIHDHNLNPAV